MKLKPLDQVKYFDPAEKLVQILMKRTRNNNPLFFRILVAYYFTKVASMMRCDIQTHDRGVIPVSMYAINLASSGQGKGHSTNIVEEQVIGEFRENFLENTFPAVSAKNLAKIVVKRANKKGTKEEDETIRVEREFEDLGNLLFSFDSGTSPAVKQMRHKLLMADAGSMNMEIDEIGSNLLGNVDVLNSFLELFDIGKIKPKLIKNTKENTRNEDIDGRTPTNMMLFGTPAKLLNGSKVEDEFYTMLETGFARRCFFGYVKLSNKDNTLTPEQIYDIATDTKAETYVKELSYKLGQLADLVNFRMKLDMSKEVSLMVIQYQINCDIIADSLGDHEEIRKAEISHRYFKALKLAGAYAFIDGSHEITEDHLYSAIKLTEDSGNAFNAILSQDKPYVKLAKYIATIGKQITHVDLVEDLPFYKGTESQKKDMMTLAIAHGYQNNIIIKKEIVDGIEFMKGESLKETNLEKVRIAYSTMANEGFKNDEVDFNDLHKLCNQPNYCFVTQHLVDGYRKHDHIVQGFDLVVLDVDDGTPISTAKLLLQEYKFLLYETKSHTASKHRYRIVIPLSHHLELNKDDYKQFMKNLFDWLPLKIDTAGCDIARKWLTHDGNYEYHDGEKLNALLFIPKTREADKQKQKILDAKGLDNMERWFIKNTAVGNRNSQLHKYAMMLMDRGETAADIEAKTLELNNKLPDKLKRTEITDTIMNSVYSAIRSKAAGP